MRPQPIHWTMCISVFLTLFAHVATASVPVVPAGATFTCTPTHVWDGDEPIW